MRHPTLHIACALCLLGGGAVADEVRLKDGAKLHGTIVGYEGNSFKLQTSYGYALVRRDKIAAIIPSEATTAPSTRAKPEAYARPNLEQQSESKKATPPGKAAGQLPPVPPVSVTAKKEGTPPTAAASPVSPSDLKQDTAMTPALLGGIFEHHSLRTSQPPWGPRSGSMIGRRHNLSP